MDETYFDYIPEDLLIVISSYLIWLKDFSNLYVVSNRLSNLFDQRSYWETLLYNNVNSIYLDLCKQISRTYNIKIEIINPPKGMKIMKDFDAISNRYVRYLHTQNHTNITMRLIESEINNLILLSDEKQDHVAYTHKEICVLHGQSCRIIYELLKHDISNNHLSIESIKSIRVILIFQAKKFKVKLSITGEDKLPFKIESMIDLKDKNIFSSLLFLIIYSFGYRPLNFTESYILN